MKVAVLGAGLQGSCLALEFALRGIQVDLFDKNQTPITQASLNNEAKIHLGFLYGNDPTLNTARVLARGALSFTPLLRRWIGHDIDRVPASEPYIYIVHRDSILPADEIEGHLQACSAFLREQLAVAPDVYFGQDFRRPPIPIAEWHHLFSPDHVVAAFQTPEVGISAETLAGFVRARVLAAVDVRCVMNATVKDVRIGTGSCEVGFEIDGERFSEGYDHVINALWDGRLVVDASAGIEPIRSWLFRMKYNVRLAGVAPEAKVPSVSMSLGPFGDVVRYENGEIYLSWYPAGLKFRSTELAPPDWPQVLDEQETIEVRNAVFTAVRQIVPPLAVLDPLIDQAQVRGGVIFAWGESDIHDRASHLHTRDEIGPASYGRYHSINTGKLTMAPLFAKMMVDHVQAG